VYSSQFEYKSSDGLDMEKNNIKNTLDSQAGRLFALSVVLFVLYLVGVGYAFSADRMLGQTLLGAFFANAFGGRAAGVGLCIGFEMNLLTTICCNLFFETVVVFFCYSLFLFSMNHYIKSRLLNKALLNVEKKALKYQDMISRYGWMGVFIFVMLPLPGTGPVAGSFIAYFLNFSIKRNFVCVLSGTLVAIVLWTIFFDFLNEHISMIHVVIAMILMVAAIYLAKLVRNWFVLKSNKGH